MATVILGINNGFALKRWPEPEAWAEIIGRELGLRHVQLSFDLLDPAWPQPCLARLSERVRTAAVRHGLDISSTFTGLVAYAQNLLAHPESDVRDHARRWFESAVDVTAALGARSTGGHMGALSVRDYADPPQRAERRRVLIESVRSLSRKAAAVGLHNLLWEPMPVPREIPHTTDDSISATVAHGTWNRRGTPMRGSRRCCPGPRSSICNRPTGWAITTGRSRVGSRPRGS
ncbi:MAG: Xylose isomerase domain protein barrel [candidate division NC10 bacterium]|nr:Xylose isomerase domain protein barrel [candidate division NC10 bacterium]